MGAAVVHVPPDHREYVPELRRRLKTEPPRPTTQTHPRRAKRLQSPDFVRGRLGLPAAPAERGGSCEEKDSQALRSQRADRLPFGLRGASPCPWPHRCCWSSCRTRRRTKPLAPPLAG